MLKHLETLLTLQIKAMGMGIHFLMLFAFLLLQCLHFGCSTNISCPEIERKSLLKFRQGLKDESNRLSSWVGNDCCTWLGVGCSKRTGHVVKLNLRNPLSMSFDEYEIGNIDHWKTFMKSRLVGEVNPSLRNLKRLNYLDLSMNHFSEAIPKFFGSFKNLSYLNLSHSGFVGKVPHHLGNLSSLQYLDLANGFHFDDDEELSEYPSLMIDSLRWVSTLSSLKHLDLSRVSGIGEDGDWILAFNMLPSLKVLNLAWCQIHSIPPLSNVNFTSLASLDLSSNRMINSTIPLWLSNITGLVHLNLRSSEFQGPIPDSLGMLSSLTFLDLSDNNFNTSMPESLCNLSGLVHLDLGFNLLINGCIPTCLGQLSKLKVLDLNSISQLSGSIPTSLGQLSRLEELYIEATQVSGSIPTSLGKLSKLKRLSIIDNQLSGRIPTSLGQLSRLESLYISDNQLSESIPTSLGRLSKLKELDISSNQLNGSIPTSLGQLSRLESLDISANQLSGSIPTSLGHLSKLQFLDLSSNSLAGNLSEHHFTELKMLETLDMSSTLLGFNVSLQWIPPFQLRDIRMDSCKNIGHQFPQWLQTQTHIQELHISNSSISDSIPDWFENVSSHIDYLDLSHNQISGKLPKLQESVQGPLYRYLILNSNRFEGPLTVFPSDVLLLDLSSNLISEDIPLHFCIKSLKLLDLSGNKFSGRLPSCLGRLYQLEVLDVNNNSLHGQIPSSLGSLTVLHSLHLHNNRFEGELPLSLQNLTALKTLDLGVNSFTGIIPPWIGEKLSNLRFLSLQSNLFVGEIPQQLCYLSSLQILDLAKNNVTGNIPRCIGNLTGMAFQRTNRSLEEDYFWKGYYTENIFAPTKGTELIRGFYIENMIAFVKGLELRYTKTIQFLTFIDLSNNSLVGEIPEGLMDLSGLRVLNISSNQLKGRIPKTIGNLKQLESLDLSRNKLSGPIPPSLSDLNYLDVLNLSFNELSGRIPTGHQLQTLDDPTIYEGNSELCGAPVLKSCPGNDEPHAPGSEGSDDSDHLWFYAGIGPGFLVGFLGICGVLYFKESWRHAYFQFLENVFNSLVLAISIKIAWLQRKFQY